VHGTQANKPNNTCKIHTARVTPLGYFLFGGVNEPSKPKQIITAQEKQQQWGQDKA